MTGRLFDVGASNRHGREWGRWFPVAAPPRCPRPKCASPLTRMPTAIQPALFIHGGYGAAQQSTREVCMACGWTRTVATDSINPRTLVGWRSA